KVTLVEPSGFRTNWAGTSANDASVEIADYASTAGATRRSLRELSGKQPGDPIRAVNAIVQVFESANPPLHLLLGQDALRMAREKLEAVRGDLDAWHETPVGAASPEEREPHGPRSRRRTRHEDRSDRAHRARHGPHRRYRQGDRRDARTRGSRS